MLRVLHLQRRPIPGIHHSLEGYFATVRRGLPEDLDVRVRMSRFISTGVWRRVVDIVGARLQRTDIFHVTGDVHFLTYLMPRRRTMLTVLDCGLGHAGGAKGMVFRWLWLRVPVARSGVVVAISDATAAELARLSGARRDRIEVVPISVDDGYVPVAKPWPAGRVHVLCVGTTPNKNLERSCDALRGLDVDLRVIGPLSEAQRAHLDGSGLEWRNDVGLDPALMRRAYEDCDVVLFASTYEGFGMPIVEANAVGRPVVTSARAPMDWVAGGAACLVDPTSSESIRGGIQRVIDDRAYRAELVDRGYDNRERFRPSVAAAAYAELYRAIGAGATKRRWS